MVKQSQKVVLGSHYWSGISSWFLRGGQIGGSPEVLAVLLENFERDAERAILGMIDDLLPYTLLFDEIYIPMQQDLGLSDGLLTDLKICMGVKFTDLEDTVTDTDDSRDRGECHLSRIYGHEEYHQLTTSLYQLAGPFAADHPDFIPVLVSMDTSVHLAKSLGARLSCRADELHVLRFVAQNTVDPAPDERLEVIDKVLEAHAFPVLNLKAFRKDNGVIDLTYMFRVIRELRESRSLRKFRGKIDELAHIPESSLKSTIEHELIEDLRTTLLEVVLDPEDMAKSMTTALLTDIIGVVVPIPTGTVLEGAALAFEKRRTRHLEWRLFVFEYGEKVIEQAT